MPGRVHEHLLDALGRDVVRVVVPADVLAGQRIAVAPTVHLAEDVSARRIRNRVVEVIPHDHVLRPPTGDGGQGGIDLEGSQPGVGAGLIGQRDQLLLVGGAEGIGVPREDVRGIGQQPDARECKRD